MTIFGEQGVPPSVYEHYINMTYNRESMTPEQIKNFEDIQSNTKEHCRGLRDKENNKYICDRCNYYEELSKAKSDGLNHCPYCKVCVQNFDHHCDLFGKCIAGGNVRSFYIAIICSSIYPFSLILTVFFLKYFK